MSQDDIIKRIGEVIAAEDAVLQVENYERQTEPTPLHNGVWWRMDSWRDAVPKGYAKVNCASCRSPVAKPRTIREAVECEFCNPPEE